VARGRFLCRLRQLDRTPRLRRGDWEKSRCFRITDRRALGARRVGIAGRRWLFIVSLICSGWSWCGR
jgi:hypothetical protein